MEDHLGPLAKGIVLGQEGPWRARDSEGWFILGNDTDPNSIKYYWINDNVLQTGRRQTVVRVLPRGNGAFAGLIFHHQASDRYLAFAVGTDGTAQLFERKPGAFNAYPLNRARPALDGSDMLEIREVPGRISLYLNGEEVHTLEESSGFSGRLGIVALGTGRFAYDGFRVVTAGTTDAGPPAPENDTPISKGPGDRRGDEGDIGRSDPQRDSPNIDANEVYIAQVLLGTTLGVFFHEFGHALIGETGLPATGPEEDVADGFSAFILSGAPLREDLNAEEREIVAGLVRYSALLWYYSGVQKKQAGQEQPWQSEHAPDLKRFRNAFCIIFASKPELYLQLADRVGFKDRTRQRCQMEYDKRKRAWDLILQTVSRDLGPDSPGAYASDAPGGRILLDFQPANSAVGNKVIQLLNTTGILRDAVAGMERYVVWPRDVKVTFRECEQINAWYDPNNQEVVMCYGLVDYFGRVIMRAEGKEHLMPR
ncbi:MAG: DUF4344 domain-containing metallopeptidase [Pseudomonadota bacterium]